MRRPEAGLLLAHKVRQIKAHRKGISEAKNIWPDSWGRVKLVTFPQNDGDPVNSQGSMPRLPGKELFQTLRSPRRQQTRRLNALFLVNDVVNSLKGGQILY